ncbi:MAG TPA: DUF3027 domain-containing protein, partial [Mycobacteriales bacterium]|nr:DUF3027 domain-containing protein [Mycobacteriales bacterium]
YEGVEVDGERLLTHLFTCLDPAYVGWRWGVQVTRASRAKEVTVNDVVLLPGPDALLAPVWVPWAERLRPGDVGVGDILPTAADDDRLMLAVENVEADDGFIEVGVGKPRVLSPIGRLEAAERWYDGDHGPEAPIAKKAPATCITCGFYVPLVGSLGMGFGACTNEFSPEDGKVVSVDHGCGAHSEARVAAGLTATALLRDEMGYDVVTDTETEDESATLGHS